MPFASANRLAFDNVYDQVTQAFSEIQAIMAYSTYKTPHICKKVFDDGRIPSTAYGMHYTLYSGPSKFSNG